MGPAKLAQRLRIQEKRHDRRTRRLIHWTAYKIWLFSGLIRFVFRLCGLHGAAYRQFLDIKVRSHTVPLAGLPEALSGFTILHLSDLHLDLDEGLLPALVETIEACAYDLCVITGDFRNQTIGDHLQANAQLAELRRHLHAPVYAVLGNHDFIEMVDDAEAVDIRFLLNESTFIQRGEAGFALIGVDDPNIYRTHDLERALRNVPAGAVKILLSHSPVIHGEAERAGIDLVLSGHTHGGQICLPSGAIVIRNDPSPRRMLRGPWRHHEMHGYTSPGTGGCGVPLRLFCPPEVTLHHLKRPG